MTHREADPGACRRICEALLRYRRVVVTSHMRPDGDSIGSSLALAWALREIGTDARVVHRRAERKAVEVSARVAQLEAMTAPVSTVPDVAEPARVRP